MSNSVKGTIERVKDHGPSKNKYGTQYRVSVMIDDKWYGGFFKKSAADLGLEEGRLVRFEVVKNGDYLNIEPATLEVSSKAPAKESSPGRSATPQPSSVAGIKVGHALNNAVAIAIAAGKPMDIQLIHDVAVDILALSAELESDYQLIVEGSLDGVRRAREEAEDVKREEPAPATPSKPRGRKPAKPEPEPATQPADGVDWDDEIPF